MMGMTATSCFPYEQAFSYSESLTAPFIRRWWRIWLLRSSFNMIPSLCRNPVTPSQCDTARSIMLFLLTQLFDLPICVCATSIDGCLLKQLGPHRTKLYRTTLRPRSVPGGLLENSLQGVGVYPRTGPFLLIGLLIDSDRALHAGPIRLEVRTVAQEDTRQ
jgi:hypothetical protein